MKIFGGSDNATQNPAAGQKSPRLTRRSSGLGALVKSLETEEALCILDLGSTSPANIRYCTERGHKILMGASLSMSFGIAVMTKMVKFEI